MTLPFPNGQDTRQDESDMELRLSQCDGVVRWSTLFGNSRPVEIELGCGKGRFIIQSARRRPEINFLGIERAAKFFRILKERAAASGVTNIRLLKDDADYFIRKYLPLNSVQAYHIYFPDPWPKKRHHKRRLITAEFIELIKRSLTANGCIFFATDFKDYFDVMLSTARACPGLQEMFCKTILPEEANPEDAATNYERKYLMQRRTIYRAAYKKNCE